MSDDVMDQDDFTQRRDRLRARRAELVAEQEARALEIAGIDRQLKGLDAYDAVLNERPAKVSEKRRNRRGMSDDVLSALRTGPEGMTRGELLKELGMKGDESGEMAVSNALSRLVRAGTIARVDGRYVLNNAAPAEQGLFETA